MTGAKQNYTDVTYEQNKPGGEKEKSTDQLELETPVGTDLLN